MELYGTSYEIRSLFERARPDTRSVLEGYFKSAACHATEVPDTAARPALMMWSKFESWSTGSGYTSVVPLDELPVLKIYDADELSLPRLDGGSGDHIYPNMSRKIIVLTDGTFIVPDLPHDPSGEANHAWLDMIAQIIMSEFVDGFDAYVTAREALNSANMKRVEIVISEPPEPERLKAAVDAVVLKYKSRIDVLKLRIDKLEEEKETAEANAAERAFHLVARYMQDYEMERRGSLFVIKLPEPVYPKSLVKLGERRTISKRKVREAGIAYYEERKERWAFPDDVVPEELFMIRELAFDASGQWYLPKSGYRQVHPHADEGSSGAFCMGTLRSTLDLDEFVRVVIESVNMDSLYNSAAGAALWKRSRKAKQTVFEAEWE